MSGAVRKRYFAVILVIIAEIILLTLGTWQLQRLDYKRQLLAKFDGIKTEQAKQFTLATNHYDQVQLSRNLDFAKPVYLYNLNQQGKPSYDLYYPMRLDTGLAVMALYERALPSPSTSHANDIREFNHYRYLPVAKRSIFTPDNEPARNLYYHLDIDQLEGYTGYKLADGYLSDCQPKIRNDHLGYAIIWYSLAAILLLMILYKCYEHSRTKRRINQQLE